MPRIYIKDKDGKLTGGIRIGNSAEIFIDLGGSIGTRVKMGNVWESDEWGPSWLAASEIKTKTSSEIDEPVFDDDTLYIPVGGDYAA